METQLIVDSINFVQVPKTGSNALIYTSLSMSTFPENYYSVPRNKVWQTSEYRNKIFYFNLFVKRVAKINNSLGITPEDVKTLSLNFDSAYEIYVWEQWILYKLNNAPTTLQDRKNIVVSILKAVNQYTGKNMNYTSSTDKNIGNYDLPFVSRLK
jgi:hypothetical protein